MTIKSTYCIEPILINHWCLIVNRVIVPVVANQSILHHFQLRKEIIVNSIQLPFRFVGIKCLVTVIPQGLGGNVPPLFCVYKRTTFTRLIG